MYRDGSDGCGDDGVGVSFLGAERRQQRQFRHEQQRRSSSSQKKWKHVTGKQMKGIHDRRGKEKGPGNLPGPVLCMTRRTVATFSPAFNCNSNGAHTLILKYYAGFARMTPDQTLA
jgi:hypothetical protein